MKAPGHCLGWKRPGLAVLVLSVGAAWLAQSFACGEARASSTPIYFFRNAGVLQGLVVQPRAIVFDADGNNDVTGLRWSGWGRGSASGNGMDHVDDCRPNCANGTVRRYKARVRLYRPGGWHHKRVYLCYRVSFRHVAPVVPFAFCLP